MLENSQMPLVVLAGGQGFRSKDDVEFHPKTMVEIGEKPLLWHLLKYFHSFGFTEFIICLGPKGNEIRDYFLNYHSRNLSFTLEMESKKVEYEDQLVSDQAWKVSLVETGKNSSTGDRLTSIKEYVGERTFACVYGDVLADVDMGNLVSFHRSHSGLATLTSVHPRSRFNVLALGGDNAVVNLKNKPILDDWVNGGFYIFEPEIFRVLGEGTALEESPLMALAEEGNLFAFKHEGFWQCVDNQRDLELLSNDWETNNGFWGK